MSVRVSLRGMLMLLRVDTLRRGYNVGFLARRLKCIEWHGISVADVIQRACNIKKTFIR